MPKIKPRFNGPSTYPDQLCFYPPTIEVAVPEYDPSQYHESLKRWVKIRLTEEQEADLECICVQLGGMPKSHFIREIVSNTLTVLKAKERRKDV